MAAELGVPYARARARAPPTRPPQREMANAAQQAANVRGAFAVAADAAAGHAACCSTTGRCSGWTLAMVGGQLRRAGAHHVVPVALATLN